MNRGMFRGNSGKISMMRVLSFIVCLDIMAVFTLHNIVSMIHAGGFVSMGTSEAMIIAGVLCAKAAQNFSEKKTQEPTGKADTILTDDTLPVGKDE